MKPCDKFQYSLMLFLLYKIFLTVLINPHIVQNCYGLINEVCRLSCKLTFFANCKQVEKNINYNHYHRQNQFFASDL